MINIILYNKRNKSKKFKINKNKKMINLKKFIAEYHN